MATIRIDGKEYQVKEGDNLLQACLSMGMNLPYFCWHPAMGSIGACRQCAVVQYQDAEDQHGRIVMGCMTPVTDGAIFSLSGDKAQGFREAIVESLMLNHPHDCPVCAEGGECHLQDMTVMVGHRDRSYRGLKNTHRNQYLGPLINHEMNRCITCYRCTRFYNDYAGGTDLAAMAAHDHIYFGRHEEGTLQSEFAGNLVEVCPTGVFTDKTLVHEYTRKWDLQSAPSVCTACAVGCNTLPGERYGKLKRIHNRFNDQVNGYFLCDRGRFGASFVNHEKRLNYAGLKSTDGRYNAINQQQAIDHLVKVCGQGKLAGIGSPRASIESNYLLRTLVGAEHFYPGFSCEEQGLVNQVIQIQQQSSAINPDIKTIESADAILIVGEDPTQTAPRIALALRQSVRNKAFAMAAELKLAPWQDAAVRNLAQDQRCPLFVVSAGDSKLDDIAAGHWQLAPNSQARFALDIANILSHKDAAPLEPGLFDQANTIAMALENAQRPLIISGTSSGSAAVLDAAAQVATALTKTHPHTMLSLTVAEANSIGLALLSGPEAPNLAELCQRASEGQIDTLVVVENDLYRRGQQADIEQLISLIPQLIVLDQLDNPTLSASNLALPAASFIEAEGTLVNMEYRAQRHFPLIPPAADRLPSWSWLLTCLKKLSRKEAVNWQHLDDISRASETEIAALAGITAAAPDHLYRNAGLKIPRQPQRYSGRTAMHANVSVHEPQQPEDPDSSLAFSMEGLNSNQPGALLPFVWAPGWNSNQSLHKFQSEVSGPLKGGTAGNKIKLHKPKDAKTRDFALPEAFSLASNQWLLVTRPRIFGSDELSAFSNGLQELLEPPGLEISSTDAVQLGVIEGDGLVIDDQQTTLEVHINDSIATGCAGYSAGVTGTFNLTPGSLVTLSKATDWKRRKPQLITSDGGGHV